MADFCKQCSVELFGEDLGDLAYARDSAGPLPEGHGWVEICEGCGMTLVADDGTCLGNCGREDHQPEGESNADNPAT